MTTSRKTRGAVAIRAAFEEAKAKSRAVLVPYIVAGRPSLEACAELVEKLVESGAGLIELGVPFSDPLADGPVIREATRRALDGGMSARSCLELVRMIRRRGVDVPVVLMGYANPLLAYGVEAFCRDAAEAGVDGLIVPDAQGFAPLHEQATSAGLGVVMLVTPLSSDERIAELAAQSSGFVYAVASTGTTGARATIAEATFDLLRRIRAVAKGVPVAVGFGVSTPEHVAALAPLADGVIVGSALVSLIESDVEAVPGRVAELAGTASLSARHGP